VARAHRLLGRVGLVDKAWQRADRLSGGEQQRVGIARALAQEPSVLLADEPVASLDPATGEEIMIVLADLCRREGLTMLVSLHQLELACRYADRIVAMNRGRVVFDGPPQALGPAAVARIYDRAGTPVSEGGADVSLAYA
jgi:phosphonate transport system ATP-binding protein